MTGIVCSDINRIIEDKHHKQKQTLLEEKQRNRDWARLQERYIKVIWFCIQIQTQQMSLIVSLFLLQFESLEWNT